jgi:hypothetical protein
MADKMAAAADDDARAAVASDYQNSVKQTQVTFSV